MASQHSQMAAHIDDPLLRRHPCKLTCVAGILFKIHGEVGVEAVERRQVLDCMDEVGLRSVPRAVSGAKIL